MAKIPFVGNSEVGLECGSYESLPGRHPSRASNSVFCVPATLLAKKSLSDYQMRIHICQTIWNHNRYGYHAFGRANRFDEKGVPHGVEYTYDCADQLMASTGREAYPAKWKKQGQTLDVVFGEIGAKAGQFRDCEFKIAEKQFVYYGSRGGLGTESAQAFMAK